MQKIVILGAGNLATHLYKAFKSSKKAEVIQLYNRRKENLTEFEGKVPLTDSLDQLMEADLYIVSVSDDAVASVVEQIPNQNALVAHTSGSVPLLDLAPRNAVFYPLQTFSKSRELDFSVIPICLEAENEAAYKILEDIAESISQKVYSISTEQRKSLHLAAVFACNFTNQLYRIAEKICEENGMSFEILHALIQETAQKAQFDSPKNLQTGPAKRGDQKTIDFHLSQMNSSDLKEIYTLLTQSIQKEHGSKL